MTPRKKQLTYESAGVSISEGDAFVKRLARTNKNIGGFSGAMPLDTTGMEKPLLLASTDGVGTKLLLARKTGCLDTIGIDLVAMVVNDLIVSGAMPLFFLDYYATGKLTRKESDAVLSGIIAGCDQADIPLLGGETAEMPGLYKPGHFDLAGFGTGLLDETKMIDGSDVRPGDLVIGVGSSGVHSNGFSLVRAVIDEAKLKLKKNYGMDESLGDALMRPTRIYVRAVKALLDAIRPAAMAHITGGGLPGNVVRILPNGCVAAIDAATWPMPVVYDVLRKKGGIDGDEMFRVFNMGIGYVIIVPEKEADAVLTLMANFGERAWVIGEIRRGKRAVKMLNL